MVQQGLYSSVCIDGAGYVDQDKDCCYEQLSNISLPFQAIMIITQFWKKKYI